MIGTNVSNEVDIRDSDLSEIDHEKLCDLTRIMLRIMLDPVTQQLFDL